MKSRYGAILALFLIATAARGVDFEEVSFETADGGTIYANLYGEGSHAVILGHGRVFNKESWHELALAIEAKGLSVLAVDFRGYGKSKEGRRPDARHLDLLGGMRFLKNRGAEKVSLLGGSMGGGAAAQAAVDSKEGEIEKLILLAHVPVGAPKKLKGDKLFIVSEGDRLASSVKSQYQKAAKPKRLEILGGSAHAQHIFKTEQGDALTKMIVDFLAME